MDLFKDGYSPSSALHAYENILHLSAANEQELCEILADRANNSGYGYVANLFKQYREEALGSRNGEPMFKRLKVAVEDYNNSGRGKAVLQEYDVRIRTSFIFCVVTNLMCRIHKKILQSSKLCYMDVLASFDLLNTSIILLYTSCAAGALPLGLFITSDELEVTLKKAVIIQFDLYI